MASQGNIGGSGAGGLRPRPRRKWRPGAKFLIGFLMFLAVIAGGGFALYRHCNSPEYRIGVLLREVQNPGQPDRMARILRWLGLARDSSRGDYEIKQELVAMGPEAVELLIKAMDDRDEHIRELVIEALAAIGDSRAVMPIVAALGDKDIDVRESAAIAFFHLRDRRAVAPLIKVISDTGEYHVVRDNAATSLGYLRDPSAIEALSVAMNDSSDDVSDHSVLALGMIGGKRAVELLLNALAGKADWNVRAAAANALGIAGDPNAIPALEKAMTDQSSEVRANSANSLGHLGERSSMPLLVAAMSDDYGNVRREAAGALGKIGDRRAVAVLVAALGDPDNKDIRIEVAWALGDLGDRAAVDGLLKLLSDEKEDVRRAAVSALGDIGDPRAAASLIQLATYHLGGTSKRSDDQEDMLAHALEALRHIGGPAAVDVLLGAMKDQSIRIRATAANALGKIGDPRAIGRLSEASADSDIRVCAVCALAAIGDVRAKPMLTTATRDAEWQVRQDAAYGLAMLGDSTAGDTIIPLLKDKDDAVRFGAAFSLALLRRTEGLDILAKASLADVDRDSLEDVDRDFPVVVNLGSIDAAAGLGLLAAPAAREALTAAAGRAKHPAVRQLARRCMETSAPQAISELLRWRDKDGDIARRAAMVLYYINDPSTLPALDEAAAGGCRFWARSSAVDAAYRIRRTHAGSASPASAPAQGG